MLYEFNAIIKKSPYRGIAHTNLITGAVNFFLQNKSVYVIITSSGKQHKPFT
jgi:hypothetical protein